MERRLYALIACLAVAAVAGTAPRAVGQEVGRLAVERTENALYVKAGDRTVLRYLIGRLPEGEKPPSVEGSCYTHPLFTPAGQTVTDLAPADHSHHRGIFCAWVQVEGERAGDWWGWGAKAPKEGRLILNREARPLPSRARAGFEAINAWQAEGVTVLEERLTVVARRSGPANVIDYRYEFRCPTAKPVVLAPNPFGGFCYRARPRGELTITGPDGPVHLPDSVYNRAETNWPASRWYDFTYRSPDGRVDGVAVLDHPANPRSTWHVVRGIHMLNPCIVAGGAVTVSPDRPLVLRYRVVAHDGDAASADLPRLYERFARTE